MNPQIAIIAVGLALLGLLLYPNSEPSQPLEVANWVETLRPVPNEELHFPIVYRAAPKVTTYDLGYIYNVDKAEVVFDSPTENGPKQFDILVHKERKGVYERAYSFRARSREYTYSSIRFASKEAQWVQVAINDWFNVAPRLTSFKIGARYKSQSPILNVSCNYNPQEARKLIDGIKSKPADPNSNNSKWIAAERQEKEIKDEKTKKSTVQISYKTPTKDITALFDLGSVKRIYATRLTTDEPPNNLKGYQLSISSDGQRFVDLWTPQAAPLLDDKLTEHLQKFESPQAGRFVKLTIKQGDWYGDYPEIREFEVFTNDYRLAENSLPIDQYNAVQVHYEDCGEDNGLAPHLTQGFPFNRGADTDSRFRYIFKDDEVEAKTPLSHRTFAYHYDSVNFSFDKLDPEALYWVEVTYLQEKSGKRAQSLMVNEFLLHGDEVKIPQGEAQKYTFQIPPEAYTDSKIQLSFNRLAGPNALVSEVSILMARPNQEKAEINTEGEQGKQGKQGENLLSFSSPASPASPAPHRSFPPLIGRASQVAIPLQIDGDISEWPLFFPLLPKGYAASSSAPCQMYLQWDESHLYLALILNQELVNQNILTLDDEFKFKGYYLHVFVDTKLNRSPGMYTPADHHFRLGPLFTRAQNRNQNRQNRRVRVAQIHHHRDAIPNSIYDHKGVEVAYKNVNSSYLLEARLPKDKALNGFSPKIGTKMGFNYILSDLSEIPDKLRREFHWSASGSDATPSIWEPVELVGKLSGEVAILDEAHKKRLNHFNAGDTLLLCVWDPDRNQDSEKSESIPVKVEGNVNHDVKVVNLYETRLDFLALLGDGGDAGPSGPAVKTSPTYNSNNSELFIAKLKTVYSKTKSDLPEVIGVQGNEELTVTYVDPYYADRSLNRLITYTATVNVGNNGAIAIQNQKGQNLENFNSGETLYVVVKDEDLPKAEGERRKAEIKTDEEMRRWGDEGKKIEALSPHPLISSSPHQSLTPPLVKVSVSISRLNDIEEINLSYSAESEAYIGSIKTEYAQKPNPKDGSLQVEGGQMVSAVYVDQIQDSGQTQVNVMATALVNVGYTASVAFRPQFKRTPGVGLQGRKVFNAKDRLEIYVKDLDLNLDKSKIESVEVEISGDGLQDRLGLFLNETSQNSGEFVGSVATDYATSANPGDQILQVTGKENLKLIYQDAIQGSGATNVMVIDTIAVNVGQTGEISIVKSNFITDLELFNAGDTLYFKVRDADLDLYPELRESVEIEIRSTLKAEGGGQKAEVNIKTEGEQGEQGKQGKQGKQGENLLSFSSPASPASPAPHQSLTPPSAFDVERITLVETGPGSKTFTGSLPTVYDTSAKVSDGSLQVQGREIVYAIYVDELQDDGQTSVAVQDYGAVNAGHSGKLVAYKIDNPELPITTFRAGDTLLIKLEDEDLNISNAAAQLFEATSSEDVVRDEVQVILREISGSEGIFKGEIKTVYGEKPISNDNILQVQGLSTVTLTYVDSLQETGATQVPVSLKLKVEVGNVATLEAYSLVSQSPINHFSAGDTILIKLQDKDLDLDSNSQDFASVIVKGESLGDEIFLSLNETSSNSGIFQARLRTEYSARSEVTDEILQVTEKEIGTLTYIDRISVTGEPDRPISKRLVVTGSSPGKLLIVDEQRKEVGSFNPGRTIYFLLEDVIVYTFDPNAEVKISINGNKTNDLEELRLEKSPNEPGIYVGSISTRYSTTPISDGMLEVQGGEEISAIYRSTFPGPAEPAGSGSVEQIIIDTCHVNRGNKGILSIVRPDGTKLTNFNPGETLLFRLEDRDLNVDALNVDSAEIRVRRGNEEGYKIVKLNETGDDSGIFVGRLKTAYGRGAESLEALELELIGGESIFAIYLDYLSDTGETNVEIQDLARANMIGRAAYTNEPVIIDGIIDKWPLENVMRTEDGNGLLWLQWDKDNLYVLVEVYDPKVVVPDATKWYKSADALELHIDTSPGIDDRPIYMRSQPKPSNYVFWLCPKGAGVDGSKVYVGQAQPNLIYNYSPPIQATSRIVAESYYILEIRIPFSPVLGGFDPMKSSKINRIGFNFVIYRSDGSTLQWAKENRFDQANVINAAPSQLGTVFLEGGRRSKK